MAIPNRENSLFRTGMLTSEKYKCQADIDFEKKKEENYDKLIEEMRRQNDDNGYGV